MLNNVNSARVAALMVISNLGCIPPQALAQLPCIPGVTCPSPDTTPPKVSITSPGSGSGVFGRINVEALATDNVGIAGVQFQLDGADLGAEDTSGPYSVNWNTSTASNGSHTLTAVARDGAGNRAISAPVTITVSNPPVVRYEESDPDVSFTPGWMQADSGWFAWSGGAALQTFSPGARATLGFFGTSVTWIGYRSGRSGIARVYVDGSSVAEVDLFARTDEVHAPAFTVNDLSPGSHTLTIEATGLKNPEAVSNLVVIDAFDVVAPAVSHLQETDPAIAYTEGWSAANPNIAWSGGTALVSETPGAQATLTFNGTQVRWIGYRGPDAGIFRIDVDGQFPGELDAYSPSHAIQNYVISAMGMPDGTHTMTIEATGRRNPSSTGALVVIDAFDVMVPGRRYQETHSSVTYTGEWTHGNRNRPWSEGTASVSGTPGAQATFSFTGTGVSWIGFRAARTGIARIYLDGSFVAEIDTYATSEGFQNTIYTLSGLADTTHTLTIEATGQKNPAATNNYVVVDAFDVRP